jgi:hypothetical protein
MNDDTNTTNDQTPADNTDGHAFRVRFNKPADGTIEDTDGHALRGKGGLTPAEDTDGHGKVARF